ncbi:MAG TPA: MoaD/ThiS family protein [Rubricoccaceae bacterium]|jgi:molybdopterin converting factor small subunit|nr:MoaD/ThiS family protein [Rubricoccaceae bacterium]
MEKQIDVHYYALFRDLRGKDRETLTTRAATPRALYDELGMGGAFRLDTRAFRVAVNDAFASWDAPLRHGDLVVFIAPTAGG